jgi:hypothetical protein
MKNRKIGPCEEFRVDIELYISSKNISFGSQFTVEFPVLLFCTGFNPQHNPVAADKAVLIIVQKGRIKIIK